MHSGIPQREEGRGRLEAAVSWSLTLNTLCAPATIWAALLCSWPSMRWRLQLCYIQDETLSLFLFTVAQRFSLFQQDKFELQLITWVGLSLSLICLFICILTFSLIRSIQSPRTTIHLHLCFCLFIAIIIFLAGITRTENQVSNQRASADTIPALSRWV